SWVPRNSGANLQLGFTNGTQEDQARVEWGTTAEVRGNETERYAEVVLELACSVGLDRVLDYLVALARPAVVGDSATALKVLGGLDPVRATVIAARHGDLSSEAAYDALRSSDSTALPVDDRVRLISAVLGAGDSGGALAREEILRDQPK